MLIISQIILSSHITASDQINERKFEYYLGYKNHVLVDCIIGLPICEITTTATVADSTVAQDIPSRTNSFRSIKECCFLADKAYDAKYIYNIVREIYEGDCFIPINRRNTKDPKKLLSAQIFKTGDLPMQP